MGTTANYSLPYPASTDTPNGASQMQALAVAVDSAILAATATQFVLPVFARKATDESRSSTTTLANDTSLVLTGLLNAAVYEVDGVINYHGVSGGGGLLDWQFAVPSGSVMTYAYSRENSSGSFTGAYPSAGTTINTANTTGVSTTMCVSLRGIIVVGSNGSLQFKWAQHTSSATATTVEANSWLSARRVS